MKIQLKNCIFKYFWKGVAKNRAFGNKLIFLQQFFHFGGRQMFLVFPRERLCYFGADVKVKFRRESGINWQKISNREMKMKAI